MKNKNIWCLIVLIIFICIIIINRIPIILYILKNSSPIAEENTQILETNAVQSEENTQILETNTVQSEEFIQTLETNVIQLQEDIQRLKENSKNNQIKFETVEESSLLSTGLEIIGLVVAVWTGISIINAVSRHEVNELKEELNGIIKHMEDKNKNEFLLELLKTDSDEMSRYYYRKFKEENIAFSEIITVEQMFNKIYEMHSNGTMDNEIIIKEVEELEKIIKEKLENINTRYKKRLVKNYLKFRKAEILFYKGYALSDEKEVEKAYEVYDKATTIYLELISDFGIKFPKYEPNNKLNNDFKDKKVNRYYNNYELFAYFANTIGEAYGNMVLNCPESEKNNIEKVAEKSIFYSELAVECAKNYGINKEVYYKNLGCNYERKERIKPNYCCNSKGALENYKKAFDLTINQSHLSKKQMWKVYYTYLTYSNKYIKNKLQLDYANVTTILDKQNTNDIIEKIDEMNKIALIAINDDIRRTSNIAMYGFVNGYIAVLKQIKNNEEIDKRFIENRKYYLEKMKWSISTLDIMMINDNFYEQLKDFYEQLVKL